MSLDKITIKNHNMRGPFIKVYAWWYNELVDLLNTLTTNGSTLVNTTMGAEATPVSRTNNPIVGTNLPNVNIDKLDAAVGADITPLTRVTGQLAVANSVNANLDLVDAVIGGDNQMRTTDIVMETQTIYQNLDMLNKHKTFETRKYRIGAPGLAACDFNFTSAADQVEQVIDLGEIVPANARIIDVILKNSAVFTGAVSLVAEVGTTSSGHDLIDSGTIYASGVLLPMLSTHFFTVVPVVSAGHIYVAATPGANWSLVTAGSVDVYVTIENLSGL